VLAHLVSLVDFYRDQVWFSYHTILYVQCKNVSKTSLKERLKYVMYVDDCRHFRVGKKEGIGNWYIG